MRIASRAVVAAAGLLAAGHLACGRADAGNGRPPDGQVQAWLTSANGALRLARGADAPLRPAAGAGRTTLVIDASKRYQSLLGVGAALTDSSAVVMNRRLDARARKMLLQELFGPATGRSPGLAIGFMRVPIGGSDFSELHYSLDDLPHGGTDPTLAHFNLDPYGVGQVPLLQAALRINPSLALMATPWSAPAWMKDNESLVGGQLQPRWYGVFADYLLRFAEEYQRAGIPVRFMSVQNEPGFSTPDYPGMVFPPGDRARFVAAALGPRLAKRRNAPLLLEFDHNWDELASPAAVLADPAAARWVGGVAWHCYRGRPAAQSALHEQFPAFDAYLTECSGGGWHKDWAESLRFLFGEVVVGGLSNWARAVAFWNLALDAQAGPHAGGCGNCRGVVTIDARGRVERNLEYYVLGHVTRCLRPGARRVASSGGPEGVTTVAFRNEDDGSLALLAWNGTAQPHQLEVLAGGSGFGHDLPAGTAATFCWKP